MTRTSLARKKILVVEDDSACRYVMELFLGDAECSLEIVGNGQDAVNKAMAETFDAVLMDLRMPIMDGYDAARAIRATNKAVPIIAMTGHAMAWEEGKCQACGMNDHLIKPYTREQLIEKLLKWTI